ncbi:MAG: lysophospholipid acyltransferase family protein [Longimicrobiales bacterium]|nr:lysophospholipid acyltransferase family protein [Longimicrobiales bacterium]
MKLRGYLALVVIFTVFLFADLIQRTVIQLRVRLRPTRRVQILGSWIQAMGAFVLGTVERIGGASLPEPQRVVPCGPGVLIVMNHQSLLDIPLVVKTVDSGYPRIVTRARYHRFIPLISHMVRLYQYPVVDPSAKLRQIIASLQSLQREARDSPVPLAIFPEGTRTRDGSIGPFKTRGLERILSARDWTIHVFVADGFWETAKLKDFLGGMSHLEGRMAYLGKVAWNDPTEDPEPFIEHLRETMVQGLDRLRSGRGAAA